MAGHDLPATPGLDSPIIMGRVTGPYGVKGWVRVMSYTGRPADLLTYMPWHLQRGNTWQVTRVMESRTHGKGLVVRLPDCHDREQAQALAGSDIGIFRSQLPATGATEYYWSDLFGLRVVTLKGEQLGTVDYLLETGANDVLVVKGTRERLIPFIQGQVIASVDLGAGEIRVDWDPDF